MLQYIVLATAWNILGGYTGYINFGTGAFFAIGAYSSVVLHNLHAKPALMQDWFGVAMPAVPLPVMILVGGIVAGLLGLGTGYLTLRLRGVFFAIATLAMTVVVQTLIVNWDYVGGSRGIYVIRPAQAPLGGGYIQYLYTLMMVLSVISVGIARTIERSPLGLGFAAIRDDELAAEAGGVPTLRLKLIATTLSGGLMGMAGAPLPYYVTYLDPASASTLSYAVNSVAMPVIGGMTSWVGPIIGAVLLGTIQQLATVTISSALNLLIVGAAADLLRRDRAERHRRSGARRGGAGARRGGNRRSAGAGGMSDAAAPADPHGQRPGQAVRRLCRARQHRSGGRPRRAARPDRAERLRQEHAGQLPVRHIAERDRQRRIRRPAARRADRAPAHPPRAGAQLSIAEAVPHARPGRQSAGAAALHRQCPPRSPAPSPVGARRSRNAATSCCGRSGSATRRGGCRAT